MFLKDLSIEGLTADNTYCIRDHEVRGSACRADMIVSKTQIWGEAPKSTAATYSNKLFNLFNRFLYVETL